MLSPVILGSITGPFGIRGWVRIMSRTRPAEQILEYRNLTIVESRNPEKLRQLEVVESRKDSTGIKARLAGYETRSDAESLTGLLIRVEESQLEPLPAGQYYWRDQIGVTVIDLAGNRLGNVSSFIETGANDVIVIDSRSGSQHGSERLVPWIPGVINKVDMERRIMTVDWFEDE